MVSRYWASSPQWKFNGDPDAGLGYCGWDYCAPYDVKRLFYQIPTTKFAGRTILSAEFVVRETHAASCQNREVQLWRTKGISSSTTWNSQNNSDFWIDRLKTLSFAYGADGCAAADAEFDVKDAVATAAAKKWSTHHPRHAGAATRTTATPGSGSRTTPTCGCGTTAHRPRSPSPSSP